MKKTVPISEKDRKLIERQNLLQACYVAGLLNEISRQSTVPVEELKGQLTGEEK